MDHLICLAAIIVIGKKLKIKLKIKKIKIKMVKKYAKDSQKVLKTA